MTSAAPHPPPPASQQQQHQQHQQRESVSYSQHSPIPPQLQAAASPGNSKRDLKSWWKGFKLAPKSQEANGTFPSTRSSPYRAASLFAEDLDGRLAELPPTVSLLQDILGEEDRCRAHQASASASSGQQAASTTTTRPERLKLDTLARILMWRPKRCTGASFPKQCGPAGRKLMVADSRPQGIFGVPLRQSITYANVAISLIDEDGKSYIYGYVPIVVAKCGVFLKEKATEIEGIFRLSGSEKRIKELKTIFDSPDRYGKGLVWDGYTVHDAANVLRRYLNDLPEPVVPLDLYERFREPLRGATKQASSDGEGPQFVENFDMDDAITKYQQLITELPPLNRQLLLYILDLLAVFAAKSDQNRMNSQNLAAIFQPGMLSHPNHAMAPEEYRLNQSVIIFLIENQDHFLIGMQGTAADEKTVQEVQKGGTPIVKTPTTPGPNRKSGVTRSSSNASAGAESVAKDGQIRRNKSTSSRRSLHSNGAPSPASPAVPSTPSGGLARSNTVPSKKSPALQSGRFGARDSPVGPLTPVNALAMEPSTPRVVEVATPPEDSSVPPAAAVSANIPSRTIAIARSQEKLAEPSQPEVSTPSKERRLPILFQRTMTGENDGRQPNKLRKRKVHSGNPSAHSSTASLPHSTAASPNVEVTNPIETLQPPPNVDGPAGTQSEPPSEPAPRSQPPPNSNLHPQSAEAALRSKKSPPTSLHSSFNEGSDLDQVEEPQPTGVDIGNPDSSTDKEKDKEKERKKRWRLSRKKEERPPSSEPPLSPPRPLYGSNAHAEASSSSIGSGGKLRHSMTGETSDSYVASFEGQKPDEPNKENREDGKGLTKWIKHKYRETVEQRRNKSPPGDRTSSLGTGFLHGRGKSIDLKRAQQQEEKPPAMPQQPTQSPPPEPGTAQ
ncbi:hypothetical protein B0T16DRAFT_511061 [Cercophora newfieldiana]|uniref:Rho-GAP domain-containing protein n=1 Tax=Cercophora newfieldiana TaxID=92897 RepID=A0AA40CPU9_9PEZI|nr:hypothetical protein B0T16DRAFT_511061 [Cercophora newfieldiana]